MPFVFMAIIAMEHHGSVTKYMTIVMHSNEDGREKHKAMGFHHGWGAALDQLVALVKTM